MPGILFVLFAAALAGWCLQFVLALPARFPAAAPTLHVDAIAIGLLGLALAALAPWACRPPPAASLLAGALVGALVCLRIFGWAVLDPTATGWVLQGDLAQHYVGWAFFRDEAWQWPPGAIAGLGYPVGTSVFYTDAHPLLAFLFKPLSGLLPRPFQYIGLTYLLNWMLMGAATAALLRPATGSRGGPAGMALLLQAMAALLAVLAPVLTLRHVHDTLTAQWLLVAGIGLALWRPRHGPLPPRWLAGWCALTAVAALTHLYLLAMLLALFSADRLQALASERSVRWSDLLRQAGCPGAVAAVALWAAGAFILPGGRALDHANAGRWSADLLTFVDPRWMSRLLPALHVATARPDQWEGAAYLGAGAMLALLLAAYALWRRPACRQALRGTAALWLVATLLFLFALGPQPSVAGIPLWDADWLRQLPVYSVFRACGRFVWVLYFLLLLAVVLVLVRRGARVAVPALLLACVLQAADLRVHDATAVQRLVPPRDVPALLTAAAWEDLAAGRRHLELVPARGCGGNGAVAWLPAADLALRHGLTVNSAYLSRHDPVRWDRYCLGQATLLADGLRRGDTLYLVAGGQLEGFVASARRPMLCVPLDGTTACVTTGGVSAADADDAPP